jgi:hypothetical protein
VKCKESDGTTSINVSEKVMAMMTKTTANDISSRLIGKAIEREENENFLYCGNVVERDKGGNLNKDFCGV